MQILSNIETAQRNNRLFSALKEGNSALQQLQKQVSLADVAQLNEESADAKDHQDQLRQLLSQSLSAQDDAEALEELEKIQVMLHDGLPQSTQDALHQVQWTDEHACLLTKHPPKSFSTVLVRQFAPELGSLPCMHVSSRSAVSKQNLRCILALMHIERQEH